MVEFLVLTHVLHSLPEMKSIYGATYKNAVFKNYDMADCVECEILCKISHSTLSTILWKYRFIIQAICKSTLQYMTNTLLQYGKQCRM